MIKPIILGNSFIHNTMLWSSRFFFKQWKTWSISAFLLMIIPFDLNAQGCGCANPNNLVVNGDFSMGNQFFTSGLTYSMTCFVNSYGVGPQPRSKCNNGIWTLNLWDHTIGNSSGNYMIIDGNNFKSEVLWSNASSINVVSGRTYKFSFWNVKGISGNYDLNFDLRINGVSQATFNTNAAGRFDWTEYCTTWTATYTGTVSLEIWQLVSAPISHYNDYGIDDIFFGGCDSCNLSLSLNSSQIPCDSTSGSIDLTVSGNNSPCSFIWTGPSAFMDTTEDLSNLKQGNYYVKVTSGSCVAEDSTYISIDTIPFFYLGPDTTICGLDSIILSGTGNVKHQWNVGDTTQKITVKNAGIFILNQSNQFCQYSDTIQIDFQTSSSLNFGSDSMLCEGTQIELDISQVKGNYLWSDGSSEGKRIITQSGYYQVQVIDSVNLCEYKDDIMLTFNPPPDLDLGPDTILCQNEIYQVNIDPLWEKVLWSDGNTEYNRILTQEGTYTVTPTYLNCSETDSITLSYYPPLPVLDLGDDQVICAKLFHTLQVNYTGYYQLMWNTGVEGNYLEVREDGDYIISTKPHRCGQVSDTINITFSEAVCDVIIPNAFSPNGDGINDAFVPLGYSGKLLNMKIFSRWGELLYDGAEPWNGIYRGAVVPNGVYLYVIIYELDTSNNGKRKILAKGNVHVIK